ncbi:MAG: alpha-ketoacid dehydrogenase subunit beta [Nitrospirae bacterium]|nr:MAG: alpha-ketoacid dehydrogenase subunit beta [Nitrospirota bacterium]
MPWTKLQADDSRSEVVFHQARLSQREITYREAIKEALTQALEMDPNVFLIGEGIDDPGGVFGTTVGLKEKFGKDRVMDSPIAENGMTGIAMGAAITGMRPVFIHMRVDFLPMCMDQIINHAAKWSYMTGGRVKVPLTIRAVIGRGWGSAAQHSQSLQALFAHIPGLRVLMPASPYDAKGLLLGSIAGNTPTIIIEHRWLYDQKEGVPEEPYVIHPGKGLVRREGSDVTIVACSYMVYESLRAADELAKEGIRAEVIDLRSLLPLDEDLIIGSIEKTGRLVVADTGWKACGISAEVAAVAAERAIGSLKAPVRRICLPFAPTPACHSLEQAYYPTHTDIVSAVKGIR